MIERIKSIRSVMLGHAQYTIMWYRHNTELAEVVREWRQTNTLTAVKN